MEEASQSTTKRADSTSKLSTDLKMVSSRKSSEQKLISARINCLEEKIKKHHSTAYGDRRAACGRRTVTDLRVFLVVYSALFALRGFTAQYFANIMEHIRKQYTLSQTQVNFLVGTDRIGFALVVLFSAYFGNKLHKPLTILTGSLLCACACIVSLLPPFLERSSTRSYDNQSMDTSAIRPITLFDEAGLCQIGRNSSTSASQCELIDTSEHQYMAFSLMAAGNFIFGLGTALFATLGFIYIEESVQHNKSAFYYGVVLCMHSVGQTLGLIAAWQATAKFSDLSGSLMPAAPEVGAWWLGFLLVAVLYLLFPIALVLYPKWVSEPPWLLTRRQRQLNKLLKQLDLEKKLLKKVTKTKTRKHAHSNKVKQPANQRKPATVTSSQHSNDAFIPDPDTVTSSKPNQSIMQQRDCVSIHNYGDRNSSPDTNGQINSAKTGENTTDDEPANKSAESEINTEAESQSDVATMSHGGTQSDVGTMPHGGIQSDVESSSHIETRPDVICHPTIDSDSVVHQDHASQGDAPDHTLGGADNTLGGADNTLGGADNTLGGADNTLGGTTTNPGSGKSKRQYLLGRRLRDMPKNLWFLTRRPLYMITLAANVAAAYSVTGFQPTLASYVDARFPAPSTPHFPVSGVVYTVATAVAVLVAGCVMHGRSLSVRVHVRVLMVLQTVCVILYLIMMIPLCQHPYDFHSAANKTDTLPTLISDCNVRCDCSDVVYNPVCSVDAVLFVSPCHAGCRDIAVRPSQNYLIYERCTCASAGSVSRTHCDTCGSHKAGYLVLVFMATFVQALGFVSFLQLYIRCISAKLRSLGLGFAVWIIHLTATVPGYAAYSALQKTSCWLSRDRCDVDDICWQFDLASLGYVQNGSTAALQFLSLLILLALYMVLSKRLQTTAERETIPHTTLESTIPHTTLETTTGTSPNQALPSTQL